MSLIRKQLVTSQFCVQAQLPDPTPAHWSHKHLVVRVLMLIVLSTMSPYLPSTLTDSDRTPKSGQQESWQRWDIVALGMSDKLPLLQDPWHGKTSIK